MKKNNLSLTEGMALLIGRCDYKGKLRHHKYNEKFSNDGTDCFVIYNSELGNYYEHIWGDKSHISAPFIAANYKAWNDEWEYEDDGPEVNEPQPNHIEYKGDIEYLLTQTSARSLIDSMIDCMSTEEIDNWLNRFVG